MRKLAGILAAGTLVVIACGAQAQTRTVDPFHKVIVSPYVEASFVQGDAEGVTINGAIVDSNKLQIEVHDGTLRLYLAGAKDFPRERRDYDDDGNLRTHQLYPDHAITVTVTYRRLDALSLRGEETYVCASPLSTKKFALRVYGESTVIFNEVHISKMHTAIYGDASLEIKSGEVNKQYYTCFGNGKITSTAISGRAARVTAIGDAEIRVNVSDRIKVVAIGDAKLRYRGNPDIVKGIHIGDMDLRKLD